MCVCVYVRHTVALACAPETCCGKRTLSDTLPVTRPLFSGLHIVTRLLGLRIVHSAGVQLQEAGPSRTWQQHRPSIPGQKGRLTRFPWSDISADSQARGAKNEQMSFCSLSFSKAGRRRRTPPPPSQGNTAGITSVTSEHHDGRWKML